MSDDQMERERRNAEGEHRYAAVVRSTTDDPVNDIAEGDETVVAGRCEDGIAYTVLDRNAKQPVAIRCEVVERYECDGWMSKNDIIDWCVEQARGDVWPGYDDGADPVTDGESP